MQFQERDGEILKFIQFIGDGIASRRHLREIFWPDAKTDRAMDRRLSKLGEKSYIRWSTKTHYKSAGEPSRERIVWLGPRGAWWLAHKLGSPLNYLDKASETWKRRIEKELRSFGYRWLREPKWIQLRHDLEAINFRLAVESALSRMPDFSLEEWRLESCFRADYDTVEYRTLGRGGELKRGMKGVQPDGYFMIVNMVRHNAGLSARTRFLLELDQGTADLERMSEKFLAGGPAYINSHAFAKRFGDNKAHWLVITTGKTRMKHLIDKVIEKVGPGAKAFLFTTSQKWKKENVLTSPIWLQPEGKVPGSLFPAS